MIPRRNQIAIGVIVTAHPRRPGVHHGPDRRWATDQRGDRQTRPRRARGLAPEPGGVIWIIRDHDAPPLWAWLWKHAAPAVLAALVFLAVWLWGATRRFGPVLPDAAPERRSLVEHIAASGRFLWQHGPSGSPIAASVDALRQRIRGRHPAWAGLAVGDLSAKLAGFTGLPEPAIARAMRADPPRSGERFAQDIETLESLRRRL